MSIEQIKKIIADEINRTAGERAEAKAKALRVEEVELHNTVVDLKKESTLRRKECRYLNVGEGKLYHDEISLIRSAPGTNGIREIPCDNKRLICVSMSDYTDLDAVLVFSIMKKGVPVDTSTISVA